MENKITYENFTEILVEKVPELKIFYDDNLDLEDKILPHNFIEDIFRYICENFKNNKNGDKIRIILDFFDNIVVSSDDKTNNAICVSFLENFIYQDWFEIELLLGPNLKSELKIMRDSKP